ncbi:MAG TPA: glucose-6-phosphate isomerase [Gemmatimonadaceae bacterium]|nr:glucose-6-phosphate isomerase [Gemmatimonadaceae bacterium]
MNTTQLWDRYRERLCIVDALGLSLDISRMRFDDGFLERMAAPMARAFQAMEALEQGAVANLDEQRRVGHYWLRAPELAPEAAITDAIVAVQQQVRAFAADVHAGRVAPVRAERFRHVLVIGIGGSALGPQLVGDALGTASDPLAVHFFDNTDADGMARTLARLGDGLASTLTLVISKSGGTKETRNGMLIAAKAYEGLGLPFPRHAVVVTGADSALDRTARADGWLARFPMWDWVGGRTSVLSAVGLLPAALQGFDIDAMLGGARDMDVATRHPAVARNPAALLALMWHHAGGGTGAKDMVVLPYRDRLLLFSRYLQQLVMESLGKERNLAGEIVHQGIAVYGNKGSTDQHAYVQQLRDGVDNFFVTFIQVLHDQAGTPQEVEPDTTSGDYLLGFLLGTREALFQNGRESVSITVPDVSARTLGALIALYERAVGLYASLVGINAYHQPGVEAGKTAATAVIALQHAVLGALRRTPGTSRTAAQWAAAADAADQSETVHKVLEHLAANGRVVRTPGGPTDSRYALPQVR